jgi:hypothetical protein
MALFVCDLEKSSVRSKYFVNVRGHGPIDIFKYNKWIIADAFYSKSNKTVTLLGIFCAVSRVR